MGDYKSRCGDLPIVADAVGIEAWWSCAFYEAVEREVCSSDAYTWGGAVLNDVTTEEGIRPYMPSYQVTPVGDYVEIRLGEVKLYYMGKFKWKCEVIPPPPPEEAKGKIIAHNINKLPCPNCGSAEEGQEIEVIAGMKNVGGAKGKFMFYVLDQHGNELSKAGGIGYKDVEAGDTWGVSPESWDDLDFKMPSSAIVKGHLELRRLE